MNQLPVSTVNKAPHSRFFLYFLSLGALGFGGPIALAGRMENDLVRERNWISQEDYLEGLALAQLAPGPLAAQLAMYLGYVRSGIVGATLVGIAFVLPSFLMVLAISALCRLFHRFPSQHSSCSAESPSLKWMSRRVSPIQPPSSHPKNEPLQQQ